MSPKQKSWPEHLKPNTSSESDTFPHEALRFKWFPEAYDDNDPRRPLVIMLKDLLEFLQAIKDDTWFLAHEIDYLKSQGKNEEILLWDGFENLQVVVITGGAIVGEINVTCCSVNRFNSGLGVAGGCTNRHVFTGKPLDSKAMVNSAPRAASNSSGGRSGRDEETGKKEDGKSFTGNRLPPSSPAGQTRSPATDCLRGSLTMTRNLSCGNQYIVADLLPSQEP
ncbi:hypothetical protein L1887_32647 [Cichorium endivia]|nr:hypothetical protein L1887_32647 [Cichorium endivia]